MWPIFKVLIEFGTNIGFYGLFVCWLFGPEAYGIPAPQRTELTTPGPKPLDHQGSPCVVL